MFLFCSSEPEENRMVESCLLPVLTHYILHILLQEEDENGGA